MISCNQIKINGERKGIKYKNGFYVAKKSEVDIRTLYCDMTSDVGAWTLLLTSAHGNWKKSQVNGLLQGLLTILIFCKINFSAILPIQQNSF